MSIVKIRNALQARLQKVNNALPTAWEDSKFTPEPDKPWQKVHLLPADPINPTICKGDGDLAYEHGIFQVSLFYPKFSGPNVAAAQAERIRAAFPRGLVISNGGVQVRIERTPTIGPAYNDGGWYVLPVSIRYYSYVRTL